MAWSTFMAFHTVHTHAPRLQAGEFYSNDQITRMIATEKPYKEWVKQSVRRLKDLGESTWKDEPMLDSAAMLKMQVGGRGAGGGRGSTCVLDRKHSAFVVKCVCMFVVVVVVCVGVGRKGQPLLQLPSRGVLILVA